MSPAWKDMTGAILTEVEMGEATAQAAEGLVVPGKAVRTELGTATMARDETMEATTMADATAMVVTAGRNVAVGTDEITEMDVTTEADPTIGTDATTATDEITETAANDVTDASLMPHRSLGTGTDMRARTKAAAFKTVGTATIEITRAPDRARVTTRGQRVRELRQTETQTWTVITIGSAPSSMEGKGGRPNRKTRY